MSTEAYRRIVVLTERLNRFRALDDEETDWLVQAIEKQALREGRSQNRSDAKQFWGDDVERMKRMLRNGKTPAQIARELKRTPRAVYRKMYKMGLHCGEGSVVMSIAAE